MKSIPVGLLLISLLFSGNIIAAGNNDLKGFDKLLMAIEKTDDNNIVSLNGRTFEMQYIGSDAGVVTIIPKNNFTVKNNGNNLYTITIKNAKNLLFFDPPFTKKRKVAYTVLVEGAGEFSFAIEGVDECAFSFTFNQVGGNVIDLSNLPPTWEQQYNQSPTGVIESITKNGKSLLIRRKINNNNKVSIQLELTKVSTGDKTKSIFIPVPACNAYAVNNQIKVEPNISTKTPSNAAPIIDPKTNTILQRRTADQCVRTLSYGSEEIISKKYAYKIKMHREFVNTCERTTVCTISNVLFTGDSENDIFQGRYVFGSQYKKTFKIRPNSTKKLDYYLTSKDFGYKKSIHGSLISQGKIYYLMGRQPHKAVSDMKLRSSDGYNYFGCHWDT